MGLALGGIAIPTIRAAAGQRTRNMLPRIASNDAHNPALELIVGAWQVGMALCERQPMDEPTVPVAMCQMNTVWKNLFLNEQSRIMRLLIERVQLHVDGMDIIWRDDRWQRFCRELERAVAIPVSAICHP